MVTSTICIVQCRVTSTRLPNKVLMKLGKDGKTIAEYVFERLSMAKCIDRTIFAIPDSKENDILNDFLIQKGIPVFRGSEDDVLARFHYCLEQYPSDIVVRATCDNPLVDWQHIQPMIDILLSDNCDYVSCNGFALGAGVEVCKAAALETAFHNATTHAEHEHVMPHLYHHPDIFKLGTLCSEDQKQSEYRLTVDCKEDFELMTCIYNALYEGSPIPTSEAIAYLKEHPELAKINKSIQQKMVIIQ